MRSNSFISCFVPETISVKANPVAKSRTRSPELAKLSVFFFVSSSVFPSERIRFSMASFRPILRMTSSMSSIASSVPFKLFFSLALSSRTCERTFSNPTSFAPNSTVTSAIFYTSMSFDCFPFNIFSICFFIF